MPVIIVLLAPGVLAEGIPEAETTGFTTGEITYKEGSVTIDGEAADFGTTVISGSVIRTGPQGLCDIVFGGKNILRFYENTTAAIDFSGGEIDIEKGSLGAVLEKLTSVIAGHGNKFLVRSPQVVGGVRGTTFFLNIEDQTSSYLCICNGGMLYEDTKGGNRKRIDADHHRAFHYTEEEGKIKVRPGRLLYHDDVSMDEIAARIDITIPWGKSDGGY